MKKPFISICFLMVVGCTGTPETKQTKWQHEDSNDETKACFTIDVTVTKEGLVKDPTIIEKIASPYYEPHMDKIVLEQVSNFVYDPRRIDGVAIDVEGVQIGICLGPNDDYEESL